MSLEKKYIIMRSKIRRILGKDKWKAEIEEDELQKMKEKIKREIRGMEREGMAIGRRQMVKLCVILIGQNKLDELEKCVEDLNYCDQLIKEYNIE